MWTHGTATRFESRLAVLCYNDIQHMAAERERACGGRKERFAHAHLCAVWSTIHLAQEMGACLGPGALLQRSLSARFSQAPRLCFWWFAPGIVEEMKILFLHGWTSKPGGVKPTFLAQHGHEVINPALSDDDFAEALRVAQVEFDRHHPQVVVGSSRGGAVAMNLRVGTTPLVLLCPAWKRWGTVKTVKVGTVILHSPADEVIPLAHSRELVRVSGLPASALRLVGTDHRLADPEPLQAMLAACESVGTSG